MNQNYVRNMCNAAQNGGTMAIPAPPAPSPDESLFLDLDGTLVEIAATPDSVAASPGLVRALEHARDRHGGALAIISGRPIREIDDILAPLALPAAGLHGLERRTHGGRHRKADPLPGREMLIGEMRRFASGRPGMLVEDKTATLALHFRACPETEASAEAFVADLLDGPARGLHALHGRKVIELRPPGHCKGTAIAAFARERPFAGRSPVFVGDDVSDEDGFREVNALGGVSIKVGWAGDGATHAGHRLDGVREVLAWLAGGVR